MALARAGRPGRVFDISGPPGSPIVVTPERPTHDRDRLGTANPHQNGHDHVFDIYGTSVSIVDVTPERLC
jgi:hypothetical protein